MKIEELRNGDVLIYEQTKRIPLFVRAIRLATGSRYTHAGTFVGQGRFGGVIEQLWKREFTFITRYKKVPGEVISVYRPLFEIEMNKDNGDFANHHYGILCLIDDLLQHGLGYLPNYKRRPILSKLSPRLTCSALMAKILNVPAHCEWLGDYRDCEPQHIPAHPETFEFVGILEL
jgi:hypothetical protein